MTEQTMTPDEVLRLMEELPSIINRNVPQYNPAHGSYDRRLFGINNGIRDAHTAVAALIARNAELEAEVIGRSLGEVHALIAENAALTAELDSLRADIAACNGGRMDCCSIARAEAGHG